MRDYLGWRSSALINSVTGVPRRAVMVLLDNLAWVAAMLVASALAFTESMHAFELLPTLFLGLLAGVFQLAAGWATSLYRKGWRPGSVEEAHRLARTAPLTTLAVALSALAFTGSRRLAAAAVLAGPLAALGQMGLRLLLRWAVERTSTSRSGRPALVFGAGGAGTRVIDAMLDEESDLYPVGVIDDDPRLAHLQIRSVPVMGSRHALARVAEATGAEVLVLAVPSASQEVTRALGQQAAECGLTVLSLPPVTQLFNHVTIDDLQPVSELDLLGRDEVRTGLVDISNYLSERRVLVTGAGGSIGSELCRQIRRFAPESLVMLDTDDTALQELQLGLEGRGLLDDHRLVVASVRDAERIDEVFATHRPEVVFHAAALKHLPLLEQNPDEGHKTNVLGTLNVIDAAARHGVERVVNVSTDKAADPTSVLGRTKRLGEQLVAGYAADHPHATYLSVRFGNVLGSRGSMLPTFRRQIAEGGPVTVTHPDATRYFMTVEEACGLVIDAGAVGSSGEVLVLDMGEPVNIADVARRLAAEANPPVEVVFTGLRPGEKLHETLLSAGESAERPHHALISHVRVEPLAPEAVLEPGAATGVTSRAGRQDEFLTVRQIAG